MQIFWKSKTKIKQLPNKVYSFYLTYQQCGVLKNMLEFVSHIPSVMKVVNRLKHMEQKQDGKFEEGIVYQKHREEIDETGKTQVKIDQPIEYLLTW